MPAPIPDAIAHAACLLDEGYAAVYSYKQIAERNRAWYRRNDQVKLWLKAFPFLKSFHCNGCGVMHVSQEVLNYCDRCTEFLSGRGKLIGRFRFRRDGKWWSPKFGVLGEN